jgi:hypothetical protein
MEASSGKLDKLSKMWTHPLYFRKKKPDSFMGVVMASMLHIQVLVGQRSRGAGAIAYYAIGATVRTP